MSANFVARELRYQMRQGWDEGDKATQDFFRPEQTFASRFDEMLAEVAGAGFKAIDIWAAHLHPAWATETQIHEARQLLDARGFFVSSLAVWLTDDLILLEKTCRMAKALGIRILGGGCAPSLLAGSRSRLCDILSHYDLVFGYENHAEKSTEQILEKLGAADERIGLALDTGWLGTQGVDAVGAVTDLASRIVYVHLKDIHAPMGGAGPTLKEMGHETCVLGDGVVDVKGCIKALREAGYSGGFCFEHEPEDHDPVPDAVISRQRFEKWINN